MKMDIYGVLYTVLFVILCIMFIGTFAEKRELPGKWCRYAIVGARERKVTNEPGKPIDRAEQRRNRN